LFDAPLKFVLGFAEHPNNCETLELGKFCLDPEPIQSGATKIAMKGGWLARHFWRPRN
jgi:hypothetical protein